MNGAEPTGCGAGNAMNAAAIALERLLGDLRRQREEMGVGIVFLPGMMTSQMVAGADPLVAIKYQVVAMLMLVAASALASVLAVLWVRRRFFSRDHRLLTG